MNCYSEKNSRALSIHDFARGLCREPSFSKGADIAFDTIDHKAVSRMTNTAHHLDDPNVLFVAR
ncbi:MAG: hypothetical protein HRU78_06125 [Gammaproteobacteria bacterium]|nr:MAG: hypothetical protein HRU78_06125 [Gammaproteobacteria bacterium]